MDEGVAEKKCVCCMQWLCCVFGISTDLSSRLVVLGDLVDVAAWGNVPCVSKIDTLGLFHSLLKSPTHAHTYPYTCTHPCTYARARTLASRQNEQIILGGVIPAVCVHDLSNRLEMYIIPDNLIRKDYRSRLDSSDVVSVTKVMKIHILERN
jgi:hypothetical protein